MNKIDTDISIEILPMSVEDIDDVLIVEHQCFSTPWSRESFINELTQNKIAIYMVAKCNKTIVGYAGMWKVFQEGHITNIAVSPEYQRKKIGSCLIQQLMKVAKINDITRMTLEVGETNIAAQNLYSKHGFYSAGIRKDYYADRRENAIIMWLEII